MTLRRLDIIFPCVCFMQMIYLMLFRNYIVSLRLKNTICSESSETGKRGIVDKRHDVKTGTIFTLARAGEQNLNTAKLCYS